MKAILWTLCESARRNKKAAKRFLLRPYALGDRERGRCAFSKKYSKPSITNNKRVINVDKNAAYPTAFEELKEEELLEENSELRQVKYLNNLVEQDHRGIKKITNAGLGYKSFYSAWKTIRGIEIMHMINKGQVEGVRQKDVLGQKKFALVSLWDCSSLKLDNHRVILSFSTFCDRTIKTV